jgi:hypothetical protein
MNNVKTFLAVLMTFFTVLMYGQKGNITGVVIDKTTRERIPFANIAVYDTNAGLVTGSASNDNGKFKVSGLKPGQYRLIVSFIGYSVDTLRSITINDNKPHVHLGHIYLTPAHVEIKSVDVRAARRATVKKIDRQVYQVKDFETATGGTAVDVLNKLPSISVDPDGTVSVRGTSDFMVYLNGKPTQIEASVLLGQISANSIENIEVILFQRQGTMLREKAA